MRKTWQRIEKALESIAPEALADLRPPASAEAIKRAEKQLGVRLPRDVVASYKVHDGQKRAVRSLFDDWLLLPLGEVSKQMRQMEEAMKDLVDEDNEGEPDGPVRPLWWSDKWIPLLDDTAGDFLCADLDPDDGGTKGQIIRYRHVAPQREVVASGLGELLEQLADDIEAGRFEWVGAGLQRKDG